MTTYNYDGAADLIINDTDGGTDKLQFDITYNTWTPTPDQQHFILDAGWNGSDYTINTATGKSVTLTDQDGAGEIEELSLNPTAPFLYNFAGKTNGTGGNDWIAMDVGGNTARAKAGDDLVIGSSDNDSILGGSGFDILLGMDGDDTIKGGGDRNHADGGEGNDLLIGGSDTDWFMGGAGNDDLRGNGGRDQLVGGSGDDTLRGGAGEDYLVGWDDNDRILGGNDGDYLYGMDGNDTLNGGNGIDMLDGGAGNDKLNGGADRDILVGGDGKDTLTGGDGFDGFTFHATPNALADRDVITDLDLSEGDFIDIQALTAAYNSNIHDIHDFVEITDNGTHSFLAVDMAGTANFTDVAKINNVTGLDVDILIANNDLFV